jgi:hypothetical protein
MLLASLVHLAIGSLHDRGHKVTIVDFDDIGGTGVSVRGVNPKEAL